MVRTIDGFFRQRIPPIIRMAINLRPRTEGSTYDISLQSNDHFGVLAGESQDTANFVANIWSTTRDLLTLAVHCSANGQEGVQNACNEVLVSLDNFQLQKALSKIYKRCLTDVYICQ